MDPVQLDTKPKPHPSSTFFINFTINLINEIHRKNKTKEEHHNSLYLTLAPFAIKHLLLQPLSTFPNDSNRNYFLIDV